MRTEQSPLRRLRDLLREGGPDDLSSGHQQKVGGGGNLLKVLRTWWLEGVCALVMAVCLVAIVLTLRLREGQPLPEWKQFYGIVNINALLSVYYTIFKGCMLLVVEEGGSNCSRPRPLPSLRFHPADLRVI